MSIGDIAGGIFIICVSMSAVIISLGMFADEIVKIIREIRRRY